MLFEHAPALQQSDARRREVLAPRRHFGMREPVANVVIGDPRSLPEPAGELPPQIVEVTP